MITNIIVLSSILLAIVYFIGWLLRRDIREQIERPKHRFQQQIMEYDSRIKLDKQENEGEGNA